MEEYEINIQRILLLTTLILMLSSCVGAAAEIHANSTNSIQAAVNSANPGDEIIVDPGTYTENVVITKNDLIIRSESGNPADTEITASNSGDHVVTIQDRSNVTIKGLKITGAGTDRAGVYLLRSTNCYIEDNVLHNNALGVSLKTSPNNVVRNNIASKDLLIGTGRGFNIEQSDNTTLSGNTVSNQRYGIYVAGSKENKLLGNTASLSADHGIVLDSTDDSNLENNAANSNEDYGIYLSNSVGNTLKINTVFNNSNGIYLYFSSGNTISDNTGSDDTIGSLTHAIFLNNSHYNNLQGNNISKNDYGIAMRYSNNNNLVNNNAYNNNRGIFIAYTSSTNTLSGNHANSNLASGIVLDGCSNNNLVSNTAELNTVAGIVIGNANDNTLTNNNASRNSRGIYITSSASKNTLSNNIANSNTHGIFLENAGINNNITSNNASSNSNYGIYLVNSNNTYVLNNVAAPSNSKGIYVTTSYGSIVSNNIASNNVQEGIMLSLSNNNNLSGNTVYNNERGISFNSSRSNSVSSNRIALNSKAGMFLCPQSTNNLIYNNYLNNTQNTDNKNSGCTWNVTKTSGRNIVGGSYIGGNYWATPVLKDGHSQVYANNDADGDGLIDVIYNKDNAIDYHPLVEVYVPDPVYPVASFNTDVLSGNAPLSVQFTDTSQYATSRSWDVNNDGIEDSNQASFVYVYNTAGTYPAKLTVSNQNGTDSKTVSITVLDAGDVNNGLPVADFSVNVTSGYAPLSVLFTDLSQNAVSRSWDVNNDGIEDSNEASFAYVYPDTGTYTAKLTVTNANGTATKTTLISVERKSSGGSGSGGGGGGSPEFSRNIDVKELSQAFITNGKAIKFDLAKNATCVVYVSFDAKKTVGKTTTIVEMLKGKSSLVSELPSGEVYKSFNVWVGNSGFATSKNIENPEVCFKVEKSWIQDKKIDRSSIALNRYSDKKWDQMPVSLSGEDEKYLYFTADVPGFSSFAITGKASTSPEETVTEIQPDDESNNSDANTGDTGSEAGSESGSEESTGMPGFEMGYGVVGLLAVFLYKRK